ncbi:hypothetical protein JA1_004849 [Spathaspora sp. JA1]|nr:hypothetical protein JA1_004849 [Spathaspora sp. JA1]
MSNFVITANPNKRRKAVLACEHCRKLHRKCIIDNNSHTCNLCIKKSITCVWNKPESTEMSPSSSSLDKFIQEETIYSTMINNRRSNNSQYVCSTHPIASLLSSDMFLCFDGDNFGLYNPWRSVANIDANKVMDVQLREYLNKKQAFEMPPIQEQRQLFEVFLTNFYHLLPIINRSDIEHIKTLSPLLLNSIFLAATRCDDRLTPSEIRIRCQEFYQRCQLLELCENNKLVLIQAYLLMSIQEEGVNGESLAKEYVNKACTICGDLALTNLGGSDGILIDKSRTYNNITYNKGILTRIFWTCFCCDRLVAATSGREMYFNLTDIIIDELGLHDFEEGVNQVDDFIFLKSWIEICKFLYRILDCFYKPPERRNKDEGLPLELLNWQQPSSYQQDTPDSSDQVTPDTNKHKDTNKLQQIKLFHAYACVLYLRCKMDPISLITSQNTTIGDDYISLLHKYSSIILSIDKSILQQHIVGVHSILHVMALAQLELQTFPNNQANDYILQIKREVLESLQYLKDYWCPINPDSKMDPKSQFNSNSSNSNSHSSSLSSINSLQPQIQPELEPFLILVIF